ncbi:MAG TPA: hypothetical protein VKA85_11760 [Candidatus Limnocylindrales bacterium]|nr:hypothetical protein [Candidatus Limnocylindrales bacterium]
MVTKLVIAGFLLAHGAIHTGFLSPRPAATAGGPEWPFDLARSWLLSPLGVDAELIRVLGGALVAVTFAAFALAALAAIGVAPEVAWAPAIVAGAVASLAVLVLFFHPWLVLGVAIDVALVWAALVARWAPA